MASPMLDKVIRFCGKVKVPAGTNVNHPKNVRPAELLRLNVAEPFRLGVKGTRCSPKPNFALGLLGGDVCGSPMVAACRMM